VIQKVSHPIEEVHDNGIADVPGWGPEKHRLLPNIEATAREPGRRRQAFP
jgi:hypothetical protein